MQKGGEGSLMYENQTEEIIEARMLVRVPESLDKREGSLIYDATKPAAIELILLYAAADYFLKNTFGDTESREWLIEHAKERGLSPYEASCAAAKIECLPDTVIVPIGTRFSYDDVNYAVSENIGDGFYYAVAESAGTAGNKPAGTLVPINNVPGLQSASLVGITIPGEDEEETERFRERYMRSFNPVAYGGNFADYREKVDAIAGVGGCKLYRAREWKGGGTVRVVFMTSEYKPPTDEFIDEVQTLIDPIPNQGEGLGIAPIGHIVTVEGARNSAIDIEIKMQYRGGHTFEDFRADVAAVIDSYFAELNSAWEETQKAEPGAIYNEGLTVSRARLESRLLDIEGIADVLYVKFNGRENNLTLEPDELAARGELDGS